MSELFALPPLPEAWQALLSPNKDAGRELEHILLGIDRYLQAKDEAGVKTFPPREQTYRALELCNPQEVKAVIIGQDPYHGDGQAEGLSFSVAEGCKIPPSLRNIYKELCDDLALEQPPTSGSLSSWAAEGVLLLNTTLSVDAHRPLSHKDAGWQALTTLLVSRLADEYEHIVFILWGAHAASLESAIDPQKHYIIKSPHPSPLSARRGFWGSRVFSKTNSYLLSQGIAPINWTLS